MDAQTIIIPKRCKGEKLDYGRYRVVIPYDNYCACELNSKDFWDKTEQTYPLTIWQEGLINTKDDPCKAERTGRLGEMAFGIHFGAPVHLLSKINRDHGDYHQKGKTYDVKTQCSKHPTRLVRTGQYKDDKLKADIYVFACVEQEDRINKTAVITLDGWLEKEEIESYPKKWMANSKSYSHVVPNALLKPIDGLEIIPNLYSIKGNIRGSNGFNLCSV